MLYAIHYVGPYGPGECIPENALSDEQITWLKSVGAVKEIVPIADAASGNGEEAPAEEKKPTRRKRKGVKADETVND